MRLGVGWLVTVVGLARDRGGYGFGRCRRELMGVGEGQRAADDEIWPWPDLGANGGLEDAVRGLERAWS
ncbi:hypothetical protein ACLOJK_008297 [Asimina triloba]